MQTITVRSYTTDKEEAFMLTGQYMLKGKEEIYNMISNNLQSSEKAREIFSLLFNEQISDLYISKFWGKYNQLTTMKKTCLINIIAEWYCEVGNIMGYCGVVLDALKEV